MTREPFRIERYEELRSTNDFLKEKASTGEPSGLVVVANFQSKGHGQFGREWKSSPETNLLFSILIRPKENIHELNNLTREVCQVIAKALKDLFEIEVEIKEPNDLLYEKKKLCGILIESASNSSGNMEYAVIGIGLNVNEAPQVPETSTIAIRDIINRDANREETLQFLLQRLQDYLEPLC